MLNKPPVNYRHALVLNPDFGDSARVIKGLFPPTGLEYIAGFWGCVAAGVASLAALVVLWMQPASNRKERDTPRAP